MASTKEIRSKIRSIRNTQKITSAMEMVAASKMRKAQNRMLTSRPYAQKIQTVIQHISERNTGYRHPYLKVREMNSVGLLVIATDRGLCGGLNVNLFRQVIARVQEWEREKKNLSFCAIGAKAESFLKRIGVSIMASTSYLGDTPSISDVVGPVGVMLQAYQEEKIAGLYLAYNRFVNSMTQQPVIQPLLPLAPEKAAVSRSEYLYEPDPKMLLDLLLTRFIESQVYQGMVENFACEQAARMVAMKNASENAGELIDSLQLAYNKARQAAITRELAEIVGGASAV